jgi:putative ABC transport system permease protein
MLAGRRGLADELREEVEMHLEHEVQEGVALGMSPKEAHQAARRRFGNPTLIRENAMESWTFRTFESMVRDFAYAGRTIRRNRAFTITAVLTLALGIGGTTAVFSLVQGILLKPLPYPDPDRLVLIYESIPAVRDRYPVVPVNALHFQTWHDKTKSFEDLALFTWGTYTLTGLDEPRQVAVMQVSDRFLLALGVTPRLGRGFSEDEDDPGTVPRVAVVTDSFWRRHFGEDAAIKGQTVLLNSAAHEIVGVLPAGFRLPEFRGGLDSAADLPEVHILKPIEIPKSAFQPVGYFNYGALGRLRSGFSAAGAEAELNVLQAGIAQEFGREIEGLEAEVFPLRERIVSQAQGGLLLALGAVGLVLLIACVNIANLALARNSTRNRELAVRAALGAGSPALLRQSLAESMCLAALGGVLGTAGAYAGVTLFVRGALADLPRLAEVGLDGAVLAFAALCTVGSSVLFGLAPAFGASRVDPQEILRRQGRGGTEGRGAGRLRNVLAGTEVALSVLILIGTGLLLHSLFRVMNRERGFSVDNVVTAEISLPDAYERPHRLEAQQAILRALEQLPGVRSAGFVTMLPVTQENNVMPIVPKEAGPIPRLQRPTATYREASPGYFETLGIALRAGRVFQEGDGVEQPVVISETVARRLWPGEDPVGREIREFTDKPPYLRVVGVVADVPVASLEGGSTMIVYRPSWERPRTQMSLALRTTVDASSLAGAIRQALWDVDSQIPAPELKTMRQIVSDSVTERRFDTLLVSVFGGISLLLACLGVYGVVSYSVARRTHEMGVRMALGSQPNQVRRLVLGQGMRPVVFGLVAGLLGAAAVTRLLQSMLFEIGPLDPTTFVAVPAVLLLAALAACYFPARRAAHVNPVVALRYE